MKIPNHFRQEPDQLEDLRLFASQLAERFQVSVFLCGSALDPLEEEPEDWDIRLRVSQHFFREHWGDVLQWIEEGEDGHWSDIRKSWSEECAQLSQEGTYLTGLNCDVQIYPAAYWKCYKGISRLRLA